FVSDTPSSLTLPVSLHDALPIYSGISNIANLFANVIHFKDSLPSILKQNRFCTLTYFVGSIRERSVYLFEKNCDLNSQMTKYETARRLFRNSKRNNSVITLFHNFHTSLSQCLNHGWLKNRHLLKCNAMSVDRKSVV